MIEDVRGNLLEADAEALVNTVNTVGVMGKGVALQFRQAFPENYKEYRKACARHEVLPGHMFVVPTGRMTNPRLIINFPTKRHWQEKARMEDIESGLAALVDIVKENGIRSLAVPPLGCGNGGLNWGEVRPRIEAAFAALPEVHVLLYAPQGAPNAEDMRVATRRPRMTPGRAALLGLLRDYALPGYRLSLLEIQKLAYFLQDAGEPLRLDFAKGQYGPYAEALQHVLQHMEGHFIRGYGDRSRYASIQILSSAAQEADAFLHSHEETRHRLERVSCLIEGFETPYGMELLATVHWVAQEDPEVKQDVKAAVRDVKAWNDHKRKTFRDEHIGVAWSHLCEHGWL
ncbi:MAG: macro domain-containing protein [Chloroflexi bacterium]|nr:macro domain-containing protein [Chloroflexota bacterium]